MRVLLGNGVFISWGIVMVEVFMVPPVFSQDSSCRKKSYQKNFVPSTDKTLHRKQRVVKWENKKRGGNAVDWIKIIIEAPGFIGGRAVREHLGKTAGLPHALFHHNESGQSLQGPAPVRMFGNGYRVALLGIGDEGRGLILENMKTLIDAFAGRPVRLIMGVFRIYPVREAMLWDVRSCVLKLPVQYIPVLAAGDYRATDRIVSQFIGRSLRRQTAWLCPEMAAVVGKLPVQAAVYRSIAVEKKNGTVLPAVDCLVRVPVRLVGPWQLGTLQARGYGRCKPAREPQYVQF